MAPVSRRKKPRRSARRRATVDFPAPAGPSMAITGTVSGMATYLRYGANACQRHVLSFAVMALPAAVGANLWLVTVLLPMLLERSWVLLPGRALAGVFAMVLLPPASLAWGLKRRSQALLFAAFPLVC